MATQVKIKGLERGKSVVADGSVTSGSYRGFRVPVTNLGQNYTGGSSTKAVLQIGGSGNAGINFTAKIGGAAGNNIQVATVTGGTTTPAITVTYAATTGYPTITATQTAPVTAATVAAAVNADPVASQYVTASLPGTGATAFVAAAAAPLATGANGTGTPEAFYLRADNKATVVVDVDDPKTQRILKRNVGRYISLGAA